MSEDFERRKNLSEEYDLKKSESAVGQLYPILVDKKGNIIDGFHREKADENWKRLKLEHIDTEEKLLLARLVANFHRRQVSREEKEEWINGLAEIYRKQGLRVSSISGDGIENQIKQKIMEMTGLSEITVSRYLHEEFKQELRGHGIVKTPILEKAEKALGEEGLKKLKKQILKEDKLTPQQKAQLTKQRKEEKRRKEEERLQREAERRAKALKAKELIKDKEFQKEVLKEISKPQTIKPSEPCPSGICELPSIVEGQQEVDVVSERINLFFQNNPHCVCKKCASYGKCGVIR